MARRWIFRLAALILAPLIAMTGIELALRAAGVGHPTGLTLDCRIHGVASRCDNPRFTWSYFPPAVARPPQAFAFPARKPAGAVRIFLVGGSAAQGDPDPTFGVGRILRALLEQRYPGVRFEVVNAAITAISSHVVLPVVRDLVRYDGDLFLVFLGNNEVVGPFGAGSIFAPGGAKRWLTRASLFARTLRLGQLVAESGIGAGGRPETWRGMEMFLEHRVPAGDRRLRAVYDQFRENLEAIVDTAERAGSSVLLTTVPTNTVDCAPFASLHREDLTPQEAERWERRFSDGVVAQSEGRLEDARRAFRGALEIDAAFAELHYRLGEVEQALGDSESARSRFVQARDLDALRFRADSRINEIIRSVGAERAGDRLRLVDAEALVAAQDADERLFHEHVHLSFAGNYLMARALLEAAEELLPAWTGEQRVDGPPLALEGCARRLAYTDFDRQRIAADVRRRLTHPPFTQQADHRARLARLDDRLRELSRPSESDREVVVERYAEALRGAPNDPWLRYNHAGLLSAVGDPAGAEEELRRFLDLLPQDIGGREKLCAALAEQERFEEALAECRVLTEAMPRFAKPYYTTAYALARLGRLEQSIEVYDKLLAIDPEATSQIYNEIGRIQLHADRIEEAIQTYDRAIEDARAHGRGAVPDVHYNRGVALKRAGRDEEARAAFRRAAELYGEVWSDDRRSVAPLLAAGNALVECGELAAAAGRFREAVRIDPGEVTGHLALVRALDLAGRHDDALAAAHAGIEALEAVGRAELALPLRSRIGRAGAHSDAGG